MKTLLITLILSMCCIQIIYAQDARYYVSYEKYGKNKKSSLYGYRDAKTGDIVIPAQFTEASKWFSEGLAAVKIDKKWGFIDAKGEIAIPFQYDDAENFQYGMAVVEIDKMVHMIDKNGHILNTGVRPVSQHAVWTPRSDEIAKAQLEYGLILVEEFVKGPKSARKFGYIDMSGQIAIPCQFADAGWFFDGLAFASIGKIEGFIDTTGKWVFVADKQFFYSGQGLVGFSDGLAGVRDSESKKAGYTDKQGRIVIPCEYTSVDYFSEGLARVGVQSGKWGTVWKFGYIDRNGDVVIPLTFDHAGSFKEGLAPVKVDNRWGYINKKGEVVIETQFVMPQFNVAHEFRNGLARVHDGTSIAMQNGHTLLYGYIDKTGKLVIPCKFYSASDFNTDGFAAVTIYNKKKGMFEHQIIDQNGNRVDTPEGIKKWK